MRNFILLLAIGCLLTSCTKPTSNITVGFLIHSLSNSRWHLDIDYMKEYGKELGIDFIIKNANGSPTLQVQQAHDLIVEAVDILVIVAANQNTAARIVREANYKDIPVIAYDRLIKNCDLDYIILLYLV